MPDPDTFHKSQFDWNTIRQAPAIHVGTQEHATEEGHIGPISVVRGEQGYEGGYNPFPEQHTFRGTGQEHMHGLSWQPGTEFHTEVLSDEQANIAHYHHSVQHGYPRGRGVDDSIFQSPPPPLTEGSVVGRAVDALNQGRVLSYRNEFGGVSGVSHVVPDPHRMLRPAGTPEAPVTPTMFNTAQFAGGGPFRHAFGSTPEQRGRVDVPGQHGRGPSTTFEPHLSGAAHRPLTFDERTAQSKAGRQKRPEMPGQPQGPPLQQTLF